MGRDKEEDATKMSRGCRILVAEAMRNLKWHGGWKGVDRTETSNIKSKPFVLNGCLSPGSRRVCYTHRLLWLSFRLQKSRKEAEPPFWAHTVSTRWTQQKKIMKNSINGEKRTNKQNISRSRNLSTSPWEVVDSWGWAWSFLQALPWKPDQSWLTFEEQSALSWLSGYRLFSFHSFKTENKTIFCIFKLQCSEEVSFKKMFFCFSLSSSRIFS